VEVTPTVKKDDIDNNFTVDEVKSFEE